jgi:hypothetical protein
MVRVSVMSEGDPLFGELELERVSCLGELIQIRAESEGKTVVDVYEVTGVCFTIEPFVEFWRQHQPDSVAPPRYRQRGIDVDVKLRERRDPDAATPLLLWEPDE